MMVRELVSSVRLGTVAPLLAAVLVATDASGQTLAPGSEADTPSGWTAPRTAWGAPDLRGVWDYRTMTPLQRPVEFAGKAVMTDEEAAAFQSRTLEEQADYDRSPSVHAKWWLDYGKELTADKRTSLIVDPPDGRIPPRTDAARERSAASAERRRAHPADAAEYRSLGERCLTFGTPRLPGAYNNNYLLLQTPDHVVIHSEMIHDTRVVPLDEGSTLSSAIPQLHGEARGWWDGDTLVVESANFSPKGAFQGATERLRLVERFTRVGPDTIQYEVTADDPATWTSAWTTMFPMTKTEQPMFEFACHEGNYGLQNILGNARAEERVGAGTDK
ncbi:MAG: hypothetical protein QGI10_07385 [Vicinamibacterales bacterium]|jgi:hypothetical protein|nr:hypothetical protein [Vicinamibacterales bacterium]